MPRGRPRRSDQTTATLRREIKGGRFQDLTILPGERQLAMSLDVSRTTLRRALAELIEEGLLVQRHGMGTYVNGKPPGAPEKPINEPLVHYSLNGRIDCVTEASRGRYGATMDEAMAFGIAPTEEVFRIVSVLVVAGRPDAVEHAAVPWRLLGGEVPVGSSLPSAVAAQGHQPARRLQRLRVGALSVEDAAYLGVASQTAAICVHEAFFTAGGVCCALSRAFYPADRFDAVFSTPLLIAESGPP